MYPSTSVASHTVQFCPILKGCGNSPDLTIRQMVASGTGVTVLPTSCVPAKPGRDSLLAYVPISTPTPDRRVVLVYRKSFPRLAAISLLRRAVIDCALHGVQSLELPAY